MLQRYSRRYQQSQHDIIGCSEDVPHRLRRGVSLPMRSISHSVGCIRCSQREKEKRQGCAVESSSSSQVARATRETRYFRRSLFQSWPAERVPCVGSVRSFGCLPALSLARPGCARMPTRPGSHRCCCCCSACRLCLALPRPASPLALISAPASSPAQTLAPGRLASEAPAPTPPPSPCPAGARYKPLPCLAAITCSHSIPFPVSCFAPSIASIPPARIV